MGDGRGDQRPPSLVYNSKPPPPTVLEEKEFLEMVVCRAKVRVLAIDPKMGTFALRLKCHWSFRTQNTQEDAEIRLRGMPGIRMPALKVSVEESRVWKDLTSLPQRTRTSSRSAGQQGAPREGRSRGGSDGSGSLVTNQSDGSLNTNQFSVYWKGTSTFFIEGFHKYDLPAFPFDRQVINLERLDFVWRPEFDAADHYKSMKVVHLDVETTSMLQEWATWPAYIEPINEVKPKEGPTYAQRFSVCLRFERQHWFYVRQVFFTSYLMTLVSASPLALPPKEDHMGDRLSVYGGGLLTLVAFRYSIADHLPCVPYATYLDDFLNNQIVTISCCIFETVISFRFFSVTEARVDIFENWILLVLVIIWTLYFLYSALVMPRRRPDWRLLQEKNEKIKEFELNGDDYDPEKASYQEPDEVVQVFPCLSGRRCRCLWGCRCLSKSPARS